MSGELLDLFLAENASKIVLTELKKITHINIASNAQKGGLVVEGACRSSFCFIKRSRRSFLSNFRYEYPQPSDITR